MTKRGVRFVALPLWAPVGLALIAGCGSGPNLAPVVGTVTVQGKPLPDAGVTFTPFEGGRPAWATTDSQGRFGLTTFSSGDGALVGEHAVTIAEAETDVPEIPKSADPDAASVFAEMPRSKRKQRKGALDPKFASRSTSGLTFTVESNGPNVADFNLTN